MLTISMRKNYFLLFGTCVPPATLVDILVKRLDVEFQHHESSYLGDYYKYSGLYADKLTIEKNKPDVLGDFKEEKFREFPTLVFLSITSGKNRDKLSKVKFIKDCLSKISGVQLLRESTLETEN